VVFLRYLDVCLVLATAPFVLAGGLPSLGYALGAAAWLLTRAGGELLGAGAMRSSDARVRAGLQIAAMMSRVWLVALAVILARTLGGKSDGVMAAALVLAAFTVYFAMSFVNRPGAAPGAQRTQRRPRTS
jgi:hypothetical protein